MPPRRRWYRLQHRVLVCPQALIVYDSTRNRAWRALDGHASVSAVRPASRACSAGKAGRCSGSISMADHRWATRQFECTDDDWRRRHCPVLRRYATWPVIGAGSGCVVLRLLRLADNAVGTMLYYCALTSRDLYRIPTEALRVDLGQNAAVRCCACLRVCVCVCVHQSAGCGACCRFRNTSATWVTSLPFPMAYSWIACVPAYGDTRPIRRHHRDTVKPPIHHEPGLLACICVGHGRAVRAGVATNHRR